MSFAPMQRLKGLYLAGMRFMYFSPLFSNSNTKRKVFLSPGERLVAKIAPAPKDFGGERLTSGTKESNDVDSSHGTYSFR